MHHKYKASLVICLYNLQCLIKVVDSNQGCPFAALDTSRLDTCVYSNGMTDVTFSNYSADHATICTFRRCNVLHAIECKDGRWIDGGGGGSEIDISNECGDTQMMSNLKQRKKRGWFFFRSRSPPPPPNCGQPPTVGGATVQVTSTYQGGVATYSCMYNYMILQGSKTLMCLSSAQWSAPPPVCIADCGYPPYVRNATVHVTSTRDGGVAMYSCSYNYMVLQGNNKLTCLSSGIWSGTPPTCIADCGQPPGVRNATVQVTSSRDGGVATYTCMYDFMVLQGYNNRTCLSSGNWSGTPPICIADCRQPPGVSNATVNVTSTSDGGVATYTCVYNYMVVQGNKNRTCLSSGNWSGTSPFCIADCRQPPNVSYGTVNVTSTLAGGVAMYACMNDYMILRGTKNITCQYSGIWSGREPSCEYPESTAFMVLGSYGNVRNNGHFVSILIKTEAGETNVFNEHAFTMGYGNFLEQPMSIDIDFNRKRLYIYNKYTGSLQRIEINPENRTIGATFELVHSGISRSNVKIAVDWISNNVYWTDSEFQWIGLQSLNNLNRHKILIHANVERPTGIAVDPIHNYLFWGDVGYFPRIERSSLAGTYRKTIVTQGIAYPEALDVDSKASKLYWVDSFRETVERSNLDGTGRQTIRRILYSALVDIKVHSDVVAVVSRGKVQLMNKETGQDDRKWPVIKYSTSDMTCLAFYGPSQTIIDHCAGSPCESICVSQPTGPVCHCSEGFVLNSDGTTCSEETGDVDRAFVWSTPTDICAADIRGIHDESIYILANKTCFANLGSQINGIAVDSNDRKIYFADGSDVFRMTIDGDHNKQRVMSATETITGIAVDWGDENVYLSQGQQSRSGKIIVFSPFTMSSYMLISRLDSPKALVLIPRQSTIVFINGNHIQKASMHGTGIATIVNATDLFDPIDITVDNQNNRIYIIDKYSIKTVDLDGSNLATIELSSVNTILPLNIHVYKNHLFVSDEAKEILIVSLTDSGKIINKLDSLGDVTDISTVDETDQPYQQGACDVNNGGCEQICNPLGRTRICQCGFGFSLDDNRETCSTIPFSDNFMYVTDITHSKIYQMSLLDSSVRAFDVGTTLAPTGFVYNPRKRELIWGDSDSIISANTNGSGYSVVMNLGVFNSRPGRLTLDLSTGNVYYISTGSVGFTGVAVLSRDGLHRKLIAELSTPKAIAIDPMKGYLFWTIHGISSSVLKRANIDGTNIVTLKRYLGWPNGIAIDSAANALYVTDGKTNVIYRCGYDVDTCIQYHEDPDAHLMDIKLLGDFLYFSAWNKLYITKLHKANKNDVTSFASHPELGKMDAVEIYSSFLVPANVETVCSSNNGRGACSTFCHPTPGGYTCGCPDGEQLLYDGKTCPSGTTTATTTTTTIPTTVPPTTTIPTTVPPTTTRPTLVTPTTTRPTLVTPTTTSTTRPTAILPTTTRPSIVPPTTTTTTTHTTVLPTTTRPASEPPETTTSSGPTNVPPTTTTTSRHTTSNAELVSTSSKSTIGVENSNKSDKLANNIPDNSSSKAQYIGAAVGSALGIVAIAVVVRILYTRFKVRWQIWRNNYMDWQDSSTNFASDECQSNQSSFEMNA